MNDLDGLLAADFGFKQQGKGAPMAASKGSSNATNSRSLNFDLGSRGASRSTGSFNSFGGSFMDDGDSPFKSSGNQKNDTGGFDDLLGSSARYPSKSESRGADASFNLDSMYPGSGDFGSKSVNPPVYDKPVYDDDIFDGVPGLKSSTKANYDDVFASVSSAPEVSSSAFDDLLGGFGKSGHDEKRSEKVQNDNLDFDGLIPGFEGSGTHSERPTPDTGFSSEQTTTDSKTSSSVADDPFKVFESASTPMDSSAGHFTDPLEEIGKFSSSRSTKNDSSSDSNGRVYDDIDPFDGLGKSVPAFSSERNNRKDTSPPRTNKSSGWAGEKEPDDKSFVKSPERHSQDKFPGGHDWGFPQTPFDGPTYSSSSDSHKPAGQRASSPSYDNDGFKEANFQTDTSPKFEENLESFDDVWLTVSEIPLFTQPTAAPPPSRPPPPRPVQVSKSGAKNARRKTTGISQGHESSAAARVSSTSPFDDCEDFAADRSRSYDDELEGGFPNEELEMNSAAAAMKEAMDKAEAKFRHAKEVRERESTKAARSREAGLFERDERAVQEEREKQEKLDRERLQREREEREQRRLEREREEKEREKQRLEREREMARQAVERATREARERAATEARQRAERAAVGKANAEARERAERAAVLRAQAEARERAAAEARERAERAAAEAKEREARDRAAARAEAGARAKAERAAVERAAAEARERAAAEARERAAAAARMNQQKNENDLESFFGMDTRATSAPRPPRASSSDSLFDTQFQADVTRKSTGASTSMKKASSSVNIVDDLSSIFGAAPSSGDFQDVEGESEERRRARLERHQRTQERAAKALAEKNQRDLQTQRDQAERHRLAETLDIEIKRWAAGKEANLRALLSTLQYVLWPECGWQPVSLTDLITGASVKKAYRKATLCIHPDKVQQKGANLQQKYVAEKVFDLLKEAWNKFNSEELF
ncbi:hypothetical protein K1719_014539 [Acacia pycnantha]|nr:hypothetical protein K1719_014539 [Acacia pycnantha]